MRFGIHLGNQHLPGESPVERFREHVEQVRLLRDYGFDSIWAGQHYLAYPLQYFQTLPLLARLAAEAGPMWVGSDIIVLTVQNPVDMAEQVSTMDIVTEGRFIFGVGLGYRDVEYQVFGVDRKRRVSRFQEVLELVRRLWTEESVTFAGEHFQYQDVRLSLKPVQRPHPPIWIGATNDNAIRRAARMGDTWIMTTHASFPTLARQLEIYRAALAEAGKPFPQELARVPELYVAEDDARALRECREFLTTKYRAYVAWGQERDVPRDEKLDQPFEELARDRFLIGGPERIIAEIERGHRELGITHWLFRIQWPGMPQALVLKAIRILGEHVLPHFRRAGATA
jgi:alkanesulfonate monooxygenase SsuD/methylene tetrahydromethanopterin reductase-like flavin-dependent oxidoreductase (luciferase family)